MKCNKSNGRNIDANASSVTGMSSLIMQLTSADNGVIFTCKITFKPMSTNNIHNKEVNQDNSIPDYHYSWKFTANVSGK